MEQNTCLKPKRGFRKSLNLSKYAVIILKHTPYLKDLKNSKTIAGLENTAIDMPYMILGQDQEKPHFQANTSSDQAEEGPNYELMAYSSLSSDSDVSNDSNFYEEVFKEVRKNDDALIIEEWVSIREEENMSQTKTKKKTVKPSIAKIEFVKPKQQEKAARKTVKQVEKHRQNTHSPGGN
ncbi:hypothetical protein Tco_0390163 [Tanacetum coccineum]